MTNPKSKTLHWTHLMPGEKPGLVCECKCQSSYDDAVKWSLIHSQFPFNLPVSSWEEEGTANAPETNKTNSFLLDSSLATHYKYTTHFWSPAPWITHTHTHTCARTDRWCMLDSFEQKRWTLWGFIASEIMSTGAITHRLHLQHLRHHYGIMSHYREENKHNPSTGMCKHVHLEKNHRRLGIVHYGLVGRLLSLSGLFLKLHYL